jgi:hypothetical protein
MESSGARATASSSAVTTATSSGAAPRSDQASRTPPAAPFASLLGRRAAPPVKGLGEKRGAPSGVGKGLVHGARGPHGAEGGEVRDGRDVTVRGRKHDPSEDEPTDGAGAEGSVEDTECAGARPGRGLADESDLLDPLARHAAHLAPPATPSTPNEALSASANEPVRARSLEELLPALVRRIAWAGDRHKGTVHLELGAGAYAGTTVTVHADGGRVRVELGGTEGPELERLRARLDARLRGHGLDVESVT